MSIFIQKAVGDGRHFIDGGMQGAMAELDVIIRNLVRYRSILKSVFLPALIVGLMVPGLAWGYVLQGPHLLELMIKALGQAKTLRVEQAVIVSAPSASKQPFEMKETLNYFFPDRFRSDARFDNNERIHVAAFGQALTIVGGQQVSYQANGVDRYKDLILLRSRILLHKMLLNNGVDVGTTSLGRNNKRIVYIIGAQYPDEGTPQVWIDKESFLPVKWLYISSAAPKDLWAFEYNGWHKKENFWYPSVVEVYLNQQLVRKITTTKVIVNPELILRLFDIAHLMSQYPVAQSFLEKDSSISDPADDVQQTIEEFQKRFDD